MDFGDSVKHCSEYTRELYNLLCIRIREKRNMTATAVDSVKSIAEYMERHGVEYLSKRLLHLTSSREYKELVTLLENVSNGKLRLIRKTMGEGILNGAPFPRKRLRWQLQTFETAVANVILGGHTCIAFKVDQIGPGGCSALQGRMQCTASEMGKTGTETFSPVLDKGIGRRDSPHTVRCSPLDTSAEPFCRCLGLSWTPARPMREVSWSR